MASKGRKKSSLQDLIRASGDIKAQVQELLGDSDRACALVGASIVADNLKGLLEAHFIDDVSQDSAEIDRLFYRQNAVLSTLANRTDIAYSFGVIDNKERDVISTICHIRNIFAHAAIQFDFSHELIKFEIDKVRSFITEEIEDITTKGEFVILVLKIITQLKNKETIQLRNNVERLRHKLNVIESNTTL